ncbi:MAG: right-handed parallel beta-helix repeat-containing protein [Deltaproteobacteria bacterium]|nr:right-handed parallel beta-helix repeat-containing protein [Deltaproteobacteria bacterium]
MFQGSVITLSPVLPAVNRALAPGLLILLLAACGGGGGGTDDDASDDADAADVLAEDDASTDVIEDDAPPPDGYDPPTGIPAPPFGIVETVESVYGSRDHFTYYVDNSHAEATDTDNPYGSPETPRLTIPGDLEAGDVVQVHGGPYWPEGDRFSFRGQGTESEPIIITGARSSPNPVLTNFVHFPDAQWTIFENFTIETDGNYGLELRPLESDTPIHHVSIRMVTLHGSGRFKSSEQFAAHSDDDTSPISYVVFYGNTSQDAGEWNAEEEDDTSCFSVQHNCSHVWILENVGYRSGGDGVILAHNAAFSTHHVYIGRNTFYENRENGIDIKEANDVIVSENAIYSHRPVSSSSGEGIVVHYDPQNVWLLNNIIADCEMGIVITGARDAWVVGNVLYNINHTGSDWDPESGYSMGAGVHFRGDSSGGVVSNTFHACDTGVQLSAGTTSYALWNNIFSDRAESSSHDIRIANSEIAAVTELDYSLFSGARVYWADASYDVAGLQSGPGQCASCPAGAAAEFEDAGVGDFHLTVDSPARDVGDAHAVYGIFEDRYSISIEEDIDELARPQGSGWDVGAYEF